MELTRIVGECPDGVTCATIYATDRNTLVFQGYTLPPSELLQIPVANGEAAVEIPASLIDDLRSQPIPLVGSNVAHEVTCATIHSTDRRTFIVHGCTLAPHELSQVPLGEGEAAVEIPVSALGEVVRAHRA